MVAISLHVVQQGGGTVELEPCLARTPQVAPTLAPAASERTVTTRAASSVNTLLFSELFPVFFCQDLIMVFQVFNLFC